MDTLRSAALSISAPENSDAQHHSSDRLATHTIKWACFEVNGALWPCPESKNTSNRQKLYFISASFKLRLDQNDQDTSRPQHLTDSWHNLQDRDERQVQRYKRLHLSKANIYPIHLHSSFLQEAVCEAPSGQTSIQACHASDIYAELL
ncbi:MAG: hypothetical protein FRX49_01403 [Trebouxia sp. A1-2]|nr:MAG: hypothetical protein FRX49_01403 [Trebouxia sp. A1-2]